MKKYSLFSLLFFTLFLNAAPVFAAPTRSALPAGLFPAYENPRFFQTGVSGATNDAYGPHMDKFYDQTYSENTVFTVVYDIDDPIVMYSLRGARFVSIQQDFANRKLTVSFSPYVDFGDEDSAIYLVLFTSALYEPGNSSEATGLKEAMQGAFFDSKFLRVTSTPDFLTEGDLAYSGYPAARFLLTPQLTEGEFPRTQSLRASLPITLFTTLNGGRAFEAGNVLVKRTAQDGQIENLFDTGAVDTDGLVFNFTHEFTNTTSPMVLEMSMAPKTGLTPSGKKLKKNSTVYLRGFIKSCSTAFQTRLQKNTRSNAASDFKNVRKITARGCEFTYQEKIKTTTTYRFVYQGKYYSTKVTVR